MRASLSVFGATSFPLPTNYLLPSVANWAEQKYDFGEKTRRYEGGTSTDERGTMGIR